MAKQDQVLQIEPQHELTFIGPFTTAVSAVMNLKNPSDRKVCFKIKTTAPKRYCVKPNSGVIDPKQTVQVAVSLQPFEYDPQEKNRHKFMVQAMFAPDGEINPDTLWKETDGAQLMDSKLKCVFVMPESNTNSNSGSGVTANGATTSENAKPEFHHPVSNTTATKPMASSSSPKVSYSDAGDISDKSSDSLTRSMAEIKRLNEEISTLRQDNIQLKEEVLREKRKNRTGLGNEPNIRASEAFTVQAMSPDATALSTTYIYAALVVLVIGIIIGKWIF